MLNYNVFFLTLQHKKKSPFAEVVKGRVIKVEGETVTLKREMKNLSMISERPRKEVFLTIRAARKLAIKRNIGVV